MTASRHTTKVCLVLILILVINCILFTGNTILAIPSDWANYDIEKNIVAPGKYMECLMTLEGQSRTVYKITDLTQDMKIPSRLDPNILLNETELKAEWESNPSEYSGDCFYTAKLTPMEIKSKANEITENMGIK
jgi:hypothetical protein